MIKKIELILAEYYYCFWIAAYLLRVVMIQFRPAVFMMFINSILLLFRIGFFHKEKDRKLMLQNTPLLFLVVWCFFACLISLLHSTISIISNSAFYLFPPIIMYLYGRDKSFDSDKFLLAYLVSICFNNIFGIICFYSKASFFVNYLSASSESALQQVLHHAGAGRLVTLLGSIETGVLSGIGVVISIGFLIRKKKNKAFTLFSAIVCLATLILTMQRGPLFALFACFAFILFYSLKKRLLKLRFILVVIATFIGVMYFLSVRNPTVFEWIVERIMNPSGAINERYDYQWEVLSKNFGIIDYVLGRGVGAFGFFVEENSRSTRIFDQMYFNMIGEIGIIGTACFIVIVIKSGLCFLKDIKLFFAPFFILFLICFVGLGTTISYYPQIMPVFWFSIGILSRGNYNMKVARCEL